MEWKAKIVNNEPIARLVARENVNCALESRNFRLSHYTYAYSNETNFKIGNKYWIRSLIDRQRNGDKDFFAFLRLSWLAVWVRKSANLTLVTISLDSDLYIRFQVSLDTHTQNVCIFTFLLQIKRIRSPQVLRQCHGVKWYRSFSPCSKLPARCQQWLISYHTPPRLVRQIQTICRVGESWRALAYFCSGPA